MYFAKALLAAIAVTSATALPVDDSVSVDLPRDTLNILENRATIEAVTCSGGDTTQSWSVSDIKSSYNAGKKNVNSKDGTIKDTSKVKKFGGNARITLPNDCKNLGSNGQLYEYKLKGSATDRVIWAWLKGSKSQTFCLVVTHRGLSENDFKNCT